MSEGKGKAVVQHQPGTISHGSAQVAPAPGVKDYGYPSMTMTLDTTKGDCTFDGAGGFTIHQIGVIEMGADERFAGVRVILYQGMTFVDEARAEGKTITVDFNFHGVELLTARAIRLNGVIYCRVEAEQPHAKKVLLGA